MCTQCMYVGLMLFDHRVARVFLTVFWFIVRRRVRVDDAKEEPLEEKQ